FLSCFLFLAFMCPAEVFIYLSCCILDPLVEGIQEYIHFRIASKLVRALKLLAHKERASGWLLWTAGQITRAWTNPMRGRGHVSGE
ncbi:MAG: hypothetical protein WD426_01090, partial [Anditalea sp.]